MQNLLYSIPSRSFKLDIKLVKFAILILMDFRDKNNIKVKY